MELNTGAKEIQQVNPGGPDKQPKHQAPTISSIDKSLSRNDSVLQAYFLIGNKEIITEIHT